MSDSWFPPVHDAFFTSSSVAHKLAAPPRITHCSHRSWNTNPANSRPSNPHQPQHSSTPSRPYPHPSSSSTPHLPFPASHAPIHTRPTHHSTAQSYPQQQSTPSASLHAALREGIDFLPRPSNLPRLPPLSRFNSTPAQQSSFGYIPNHFFYSPPQSPQDSDPPQHLPAQQSAASSSSAHALAGPSNTKLAVDSTAATPLVQPATAYPSLGSSEYHHSAYPPVTSQSQYSEPFTESHTQQPNPTIMPSASASTSATTASRKRSRPSFSGTPPSSSKRRLNHHPIALDDSDGEDDEIEELGPDNDILAKEREALVNKQREESSKVNRIGDLNCMICLEHFTNMTATHCGHIFCHECLTQALIASQRNSDHNYGTCPACRKPIKPKGKNQIVPLALKKGKRK